MGILICNTFDDAIVAYVVNKWTNNSSAKSKLGRILVQKICYFLKAKGIPLDYNFDIYHYGPYSQELYFRVEELVADGIISDVSGQESRSEYIPGTSLKEIIDAFHDDLSHWEKDIDKVVDLFKEATPTKMELLATTHYLQNSLKNFYSKSPAEELVVEKVYTVKQAKFTKKEIRDALKELAQIGLAS